MARFLFLAVANLTIIILLKAINEVFSSDIYVVFLCGFFNVHALRILITPFFLNLFKNVYTIHEIEHKHKIHIKYLDLRKIHFLKPFFLLINT